MKRSFYFLFIILTIVLGQFHTASAATFTGTGLWTSAANWSTGVVPIAGEDVIISGICTVNVNTNIVNNVQVDGTLNFTTNNLSDLKYSGNFTINTAGVVNNTGSIEKTTNSGGTFTINGNGTYIHDPYNNVILDETIFNGSESFSNTSNITIKKWYDISIPVGHPNRVQISNFGNLTLSVNTTGLRWNQKGYFSVNRIKGTFNITDGIILMDDGQGATAQLILQQVNISGNGSLIVRAGFAASFTLTTGAFTDVSTSTNPTVLADTTFCLFQWTASGSVQLGHYFYGMVGTGTETGGDLRITITGNLTINGNSSCHLVSQCDAPLRLSVTGITTIGGTPTKVRFLDGNNGLLTFSTNDFIISGGNDNVLMGGGTSIVPKATGIPSITINNDFLITGASVNYILNSDTNVQKLRLTVGRDFIMSNTGAQLIVAKHPGANTFKTTRHFTITGGQFTGEIDTNNIALDSMIIGGDFTFNSTLATNFCIVNASKGNTVIQTTGNFSVLASGNLTGQGVYGIYRGGGTMNMTVGGNYIQGPAVSQFNVIYNDKKWLGTGGLTFSVTGTFDQDGGIFRGVNAPGFSTTNTMSFTVNAIDFDGGNFSAFHTANVTNATAVFNITNNCKVDFNAVADTFMFAGLPSAGSDLNLLTSNITIGGSLVISGANGQFMSSFGADRETVNITGSVNISAGNNAFNPAHVSLINSSHSVTMTVGGSMTFSGGTTYLSQLSDTLSLTINGDLVIAGGTITLKGSSDPGYVNVLDGFNMTGGTLHFHNNTINTTSNPTFVTINSDGDNTGDFIHTGGVISFDNNAGGSTQPHSLIVMSPNYTIGGTGSMTRNGTNPSNYYGAVVFQRNGTIDFRRTSNTHSIQQVHLIVENGTTVEVISGDVQIASWSTAFSIGMMEIKSTGTLRLRGSSIRSNSILPNSGITVYGRLALQHPNGFYNGTANAALDGTGGMTYYLPVTSTVEYYGTTNQIITGINVGTATVGSLHKYYNLDINMSGAAYAYPTNVPNVNSVFVRKKLTLLAGELNLDNDHNTANGGRAIILEDSTSAAISQAGGFIRSETEDGSGLVKWVIKRATGPHIIPFGYTLNAADRIPFTFGIPTGNADTVMVSTYHTNWFNLPYPPTVLHVRNNSGLDNSNNTVDRFWYINTTGTITNANMTFTVVSGAGASVDEMFNGATITTLRAQRWIPPNSWEVAYQGTQTNPISNGTLVTGASLFPYWWTLSGNNSPLPVQMVNFSGGCDEKNTYLKWTTASETNNDHFAVTRSTDGVSYEPVGTVAGHGNSTEALSYKFIDENPVTGYAYYKLLQVDFDGRTEEFGPVIVRSCKDSPTLGVLVLSAQDGTTNLMVESPYSGNFRIDLINSQGQLVLTTETFIAEGSNLVPITTDKVSPGIYHIRLQSDRDMVSRKAFINKN
jgi:hypothetical protein